MIRLWNRVGAFRLLSVAVLVAGVVGGMALGGDRHHRQSANRSEFVTASDMADAQTLRDEAVERQQLHAAARNAQREAQAKADAAAAAAAAQAKATNDAAARKPGGTTAPPKQPGPPPNYGPIPADCSGYTGNPAIGCKLLLEAGFGLDQMNCLYNLWMKESHWSTSSANSSGAYGIPQALPGMKMATYGSDWRTNPVTQIKWGLGYIKGRYGKPCVAWDHWRNFNWY